MIHKVKQSDCIVGESLRKTNVVLFGSAENCTRLMVLPTHGEGRQFRYYLFGYFFGPHAFGPRSMFTGSLCYARYDPRYSADESVCYDTAVFPSAHDDEPHYWARKTCRGGLPSGVAPLILDANALWGLAQNARIKRHWEPLHDWLQDRLDPPWDVLLGPDPDSLFETLTGHQAFNFIGPQL